MNIKYKAGIIKKNAVIAIDGPSASGKTTIGIELARMLNFKFIDTGGMYRAFALYAINSGIDLNDETKLKELFNTCDIKVEENGHISKLILNGKDVSSELKGEKIGDAASCVSKHPYVRYKMADIQRNIAKRGGIIMVGRDIGTFVLPEADVKIYLTANTKIRALRRFNELCGIKVSLEDIIVEMNKRDKRDMTRDIAPLFKADDAIEIDTSEMPVSEVLNQILKILKIKGIIK